MRNLPASFAGHASIATDTWPHHKPVLQTTKQKTTKPVFQNLNASICIGYERPHENQSFFVSHPLISPIFSKEVPKRLCTMDINWHQHHTFQYEGMLNSCKQNNSETQVYNHFPSSFYKITRKGLLKKQRLP